MSPRTVLKLHRTILHLAFNAQIKVPFPLPSSSIITSFSSSSTSWENISGGNEQADANVISNNHAPVLPSSPPASPSSTSQSLSQSLSSSSTLTASSSSFNVGSSSPTLFLAALSSEQREEVEAIEKELVIRGFLSIVDQRVFYSF
eukprot:TRINITY_DN9459_c0_g1_i1.p1 TRINITY_DN9459_c0_g1~~TRINITY_DN9459_c0_g1_i1.p1  ORF type:complete len:146 (+),score=43.24 TRINITY_DN9459_c0_g1_i1:275-712(+)